MQVKACAPGKRPPGATRHAMAMYFIFSASVKASPTRCRVSPRAARRGTRSWRPRSTAPANGVRTTSLPASWMSRGKPKPKRIGWPVTSERSGGEPELAAAGLLYAAPPPGRFVTELAAVLPEPSALHAQLSYRTQRQKPTGIDDRPRPSALAHLAGPAASSAPASLTWGGWPPTAQDNLPTGIRPSQAGGFRAPVQPKKPADSEPRPPEAAP